MKRKYLRIISLLILNSSSCLSSHAQGTAFTYQGRLNDGANPASGTYDLRFTVYDTLAGAFAIAGPVTNSAVGVSNGLFTVTLDFGTSAFTGADRWLQIGVRSNGGGAFATLTPRQKITPTPYAVFANTAAAAVNFSGAISSSQLPTNVVINFSSAASGLDSTALGHTTLASGSASTAMGEGNTASGSYSTAMGQFNYASGDRSTAMGSFTIASGIVSTAMGYSTTASGSGSTAMGDQTTAGGNTSTAMGFGSTAGGNYSLAAGNSANAALDGTFVWNSFGFPNVMVSDHQFSVFGAHGMNVDYFTQRADGGGSRWVYIGDTFAGDTIHTWNGAHLTDGGVWANASDKNRKTDFATVNTREVLAQLAALPVSEWRYTNEVSGIKHLGPTAQDFKSVFGLGTDDKSIGTVDEGGVALAAIQGLNEKLEVSSLKLEAENAELKERNDSLEQRLEALEKIVRNQKSN